MISSPLLPPQPTLPRQTSTLDHLFSRFIHKQEEDLGVRKPLTTNGGDEKDGLARLFGNLGVVKADAKTAEEEEEDVLARLLDSTPAPQIAPVTKKQEKLLALLRQPPFSSESAFVRPHQANLLAVLGPNPRSRTPSPAETMPQLAARPVQDATPLNNPDRSDAGKNWKEQVVLGQNTAGFGTAMPPPFPHQPSAPPPGASFIPHEPTQSHWSIAPNAPGIVSHQIIPTQGVPYNPRPYQPHHSQQTFFPNHQPQTNHYRPPQPYHEPPTIATVRPRHLPFSAPPPPLNDLQRNVLSALRPPMPLPANHRPPPGRDYRPPDRPMPSPSGPFIPHLNGQAMLPKSFDQVSSHGQGQMGYPHFNQPFRPFQQAQSVAPWNPPPPTLSGGGGRVHQPQPRGASNGNGILANMHEPDVTHGFGR